VLVSLSVFVVVPAMVRVLPRAVLTARGGHAVEAQRLGGTARPWSKRQSDLAAASPSGRCVTMSQAGGLGTHDAVIAMSDVTMLTHVTSMGDVTAVGRASAIASKTAASAAAPYEMAASKAATPGVPATASTPVTTAAAAAATTRGST
jgi:hypothetical protein